LFSAHSYITGRQKSQKKTKYIHKQSKIESQRKVAYSKNKKAIDINITQMMVSKQWVKR